MERIVVYGKGGVGKSTIASSLSAAYARRGLRVLHIGCDPKQDSTLRIAGGKVKSVMEASMSGEITTKDNITTKGVFGIDCVECGGPKPGVGCAGRGIAKTFEILENLNTLNEANYDIALFDVLGDVVCGGFAAPLRDGFGKKVFIVVSEEIMSMYAANKIISAIKTYEYNGVYLGGIILNMRNNSSSIGHVKKFADSINANIISIIPRSNLIAEAEKYSKTVVEMHPESEISGKFNSMAGEIIKIRRESSRMPNAIKEMDFNSLFRG
jgi:nitrogenase iron protein NifH